MQLSDPFIQLHGVFMSSFQNSFKSIFNNQVKLSCVLTPVTWNRYQTGEVQFCSELSFRSLLPKMTLWIWLWCPSVSPSIYSFTHMSVCPSTFLIFLSPPLLLDQLFWNFTIWYWSWVLGFIIEPLDLEFDKMILEKSLW